MAPELGRGAKSAGASSDLWSFGVIAYEILSGRFPFVTPPVIDAMSARAIAAPPPFDDGAVPAAIAAIVLRCLDVDPTARPTAADVANALAAS